MPFNWFEVPGWGLVFAAWTLAFAVGLLIAAFLVWVDFKNRRERRRRDRRRRGG